MQFKTAAFAAFLAAAATPFAAAQCAEASRFGDTSITPTTFAPGDSYFIFTNFTCGISQFNIVPQLVTYSLNVLTNNNGHESPIVLEQHPILGHPSSLLDIVNSTIPHAFFVAGAQYTLVTTITYAVNGTDGSPFLTQGGVETPVTVKVPSS